MKNYEYSHEFYAGSETLETRADTLRRVLDQQIEEPVDEYVRGYAVAARVGLDYPGLIREFFYFTLEHNPNLGASHLANKTRYALQKQLYHPGFTVHADQLQYESRHRYPHDYHSSEAWTEVFEEILRDPDLFGSFLVDVWVRPVATNKQERGKTLKGVAVLAHHLGRMSTFSVLDAGCSQNATLKHLAGAADFRPTAVYKPYTHLTADNLVLSQPHMAAVDQLVNEDLPLTLGVGIDRFDPAEQRQWALACHHPSEVFNEARVASFDALVTADHPNVQFYQGDFADLNDADFNATYPDFEPAIVHLSMMLYQNSPLNQELLLQKAKQKAREFVVVFDFAYPDPQDPTRLLIRTDWQGDLLPCRTLIWDVREENPSWHEIALWRNGRCREMVQGMGRLAIVRGIQTAKWPTPYTT